jgi:hypothetical protein
MHHIVTFLSRERKVTNQASPAAMPDKHQTPIRRGPAGCPVLLGKGGSAQLAALKQHFAPKLKYGALSCDARRVPKGEGQNQLNKKANLNSTKSEVNDDQGV